MNSHTYIHALHALHCYEHICTNIHRYLYICTYIYMCVYYIHMYISIHIHIYICIYVHVYMYVCMYSCMCIKKCAYACMYVHAPVYKFSTATRILRAEGYLKASSYSPARDLFDFVQRDGKPANHVLPRKLLERWLSDLHCFSCGSELAHIGSTCS